MRWPWRPDIWPDAGADAQVALISLLSSLAPLLAARNIELELEVPPASMYHVKPRVPEGVKVAPVEYADIWLRDCAPFYVEGESPVVHTTGFNGWGGLDADFKADLTALDALTARYSLQTKNHSLILEGGSLHTDGAGQIIYVAASILDEKRNPGMKQAQFERFLTQNFAATQCILLEAGLQSDETGGHADNLLTFMDPSNLLLSLPESSQHPDYQRCLNIRAQLERELPAVRIHPMPLPVMSLSKEEAERIQPKRGITPRPAGMALTASYCNGIRIADIYVVPQFGVDEDAEVMARLKRTFPHLTLLPANARALLVGGGGWHCASHAVV